MEINTVATRRNRDEEVAALDTASVRDASRPEGFRCAGHDLGQVKHDSIKVGARGKDSGQKRPTSAADIDDPAHL